MNPREGKEKEGRLERINGKRNNRGRTTQQDVRMSRWRPGFASCGPPSLLPCQISIQKRKGGLYFTELRSSFFGHILLEVFDERN